jgi:hypothetical protein
MRPLKKSLVLCPKRRLQSLVTNLKLLARNHSIRSESLIRSSVVKIVVLYNAYLMSPTSVTGHRRGARSQGTSAFNQ